jgi:hypothetical protein
MNWGTGITIGIALFVLMTLGLVMVAVRQDHELVAEDYYERELDYQAKMEHAVNAKDSGINPVVSQGEAGCVEVMFSVPVKGKIVLFRPSDKSMDSESVFASDESGKTQYCPERLAPGFWKISLEWEHNGKVCYSEHSLHVQG